MKVAIPSKPGQRLQYLNNVFGHGNVERSQSLPNQVNDFNPLIPVGEDQLVVQYNCRNPFQTRSTTSIIGKHLDSFKHYMSRNPFQTRSTTSICGQIESIELRTTMSQSLPNQVNDFNGMMDLPLKEIFLVSQSLPNQVNDFNSITSTNWRTL